MSQVTQVNPVLPAKMVKMESEAKKVSMDLLVNQVKKELKVSLEPRAAKENEALQVRMVD